MVLAKKQDGKERGEGLVTVHFLILLLVVRHEQAR